MAHVQHRDVLIVDDDPAVRTLISVALHHQSLSSDGESDEVEALVRLATTTYAVLLLDGNLPRIGGPEMLARLSAPQDRQPPVVLLTTANLDREQLGDIADYVHAVLRKPLDLIDLVGLVRGCVDAWNLGSREGVPRRVKHDTIVPHDDGFHRERGSA
jgi:CheY-like chemotaxis protein